MAAIKKGIAISFANTPQAKDDLFTGAGLTEDSLGITYLDVMANDLGGAAKKLYSLDDGPSAGGSSPTDLLTQDAVGAMNTSLHGATIWITADGKVAYDASTLDPAFQDSLQQLAAGEFATDSFTYAIRLGNGALSWATETVQIAGVNDAPTAVGDSRTATEDVTLLASSVLTNDTDPDIEDLDVAAVKVGATTIVDGGAGDTDAAVNGSITFATTAGGTATIDLEAGTFSYDQNGVFNGLDTGENGADSFQYQATDGTDPSGFATVDITINGVTDNAAPIANGDIVLTNIAQGTGILIPAVALLFNDTDPVNGPLPLSINFVANPATNDFVALSSGDVLYTDNVPLDGSDGFFDYKAFDGTSQSAAATVTVDTQTGNTVTGAEADEILIGGGGNDTLNAGGGADFLFGNAGNDILRGGAGNDAIDGGTGTADLIDFSDATAAITFTLSQGTNGGGFFSSGALSGIGTDSYRNIEGVIGSSFNDTLTGSSGNDVIRGGTGQDSVDGGADNDTIVMLVTSGNVDTANGNTGTDTLALTGVVPGTGVVVVDLSVVPPGDQVLSIGGVADALVQQGFENLDASGLGSSVNVTGSGIANIIIGSNGNDTISGGGGNDTITGGLGDDIFDYNAIADSGVGSGNRDVITDFLAGTDDIDLLGIDAYPGTGGDDAFAFVAAQTAATMANSITWEQTGGNTIVRGDVNGDTTADFEIQLTGNIGLTGGDFFL